MCVKNGIPLSLNGDTFQNLKENFDTVLARTVGNMEMKGADEATITLKLLISTKKENIGTPDNPEEATIPTFKHDISSVMQVKDKVSGTLAGNYALVWDDEEKKYVMKKITDGQLSMFDDDGEVSEEIIETYEPVEDDGPKELDERTTRFLTSPETSDGDEDEYPYENPDGEDA